MSKVKKPRLGRGLNSLMSTPVSIEPGEAGEVAAGLEDSGDAAAQEGDRPLAYLSVGVIGPNRYQPRRRFDEASLDQLAHSIKQDGLMQPVIVRPAGSGQYELVAGERRWRAAKKAGLEVIPALVRDLDDRQLAEWAVIENLQREDLDPIDRAEAFLRLIDQFHLTHEQVAERVSVDRSTITNLIRLLDLPAEAQDLVRTGQLTYGHGRALLGITDHELQLKLAHRSVAQGWSVRKIEEAVRKLNGPVSSRHGATATRSAHLADLERQISQQLNTKVILKTARKKNAGTLMIDYYDLDQFDALMEKLGVNIQ